MLGTVASSLLIGPHRPDTNSSSHVAKVPLVLCLSARSRVQQAHMPTRHPAIHRRASQLSQTKTIQINYQPVYLYRYRSILSNGGKLRRTSLVHRLAAQLPIFQPQHVVGFPEVNLPMGGAFVGTV